ncbi:AT-rich interactive domain-containing protein 3B isoform X1 [Fundulus heteroclitus]|uniref:AT-rich interactive domain-containing protein 3B isoform X1 n=1 Tax=Fundulus heteroclitus TaxID=8078 RepID=UPI00165B34D9|nr:AT-rich interactive domain-containing protein 3B isoform X1 [Fundulus heteroclitus]
MKTKEHSRQVRDEVVEQFNAGLGYKTISKALTISRSTVGSIVRKWKVFGTTANLARHGRPPKDKGRTREAAKMPVVTLEGLQGSTTQSNLSEEGSSVGGLQHSIPAGVKLEALMEQLQRHQGANLEMNLQEKHLLQAQFLLAQQAAAAAARASSSRPDSAPFGKADGQIGQVTQHVRSSPLVKVEPKQENKDSGGEEQEMLEPEEEDELGDEADEKIRIQQVSGFQPYAASLPSAVQQTSEPSPSAVKEEHEEKNLSPPVGQNAFTSPNGLADWGYDELFKQRGSSIWTEESDGAKARGEPSRDFAKLYELDNDPQRKDFLDELFVFMQKRGTPVNRIPIMAKQVLDLYKLYKLVTEKGGLVEVINKKIWREITKGLSLPTSITSAAFTLRTQYMKYLYPFECEKKRLSSPGELQAAIDGNRRESRRPSYTSSLYRYSPSQGSAPHSLLSSPTVQTAPATHNGMSMSASPNLKRSTDETSTPVISGLPMALGHHQHQHSHPHQLAQAATLEHLRERLDRAAGGAPADGPEKKMMRLAEEQQRLMQQALQQNLLAMASHFNPMSLKLNNGQEKKKDLSLSISANGPASISVSVEVNGTVYSGTLLAQKSAAPVPSQTVTPAGTSGFSALSSSQSPSSSSSTSAKGPN